MRSAGAVIVALALAAVVGLAAAALAGDRSQAFTLGVARSSPVELKPRQTVCQAPVTVPPDGAFDGIRVSVGTRGRPGPPLEATVRTVDPADPAATTGAVLARGTLARGYREYPAVPAQTVWVGRVPAGRTVTVCLQNRGRGRVAVFGDVDAAARTSTSFVEGAGTGLDVALDFQRREPRSLASLIPAMLDRAALFRAQWIGTWTYWLLGALVLLAVPALLVRAVRDAARDTA